MSDMFFSHAALSLANLTMPKYEGMDKETIFRVARDAFGFNGTMSEEGFLKLQQKIAECSSNAVRLEKVEYSDWKGPRVKGPCSYLVLVKGEERVHFEFGPYVPPFQACRTA